MRLDVHVHLDSVPGDASGKLDAILSKLGEVLTKESQMATALDDLKREVEENGTVTQSAITLLGGLKEKLDEAIASGDPTKLQELSAALDSQQQALAAAVTANTPASP